MALSVVGAAAWAGAGQEPVASRVRPVQALDVSRYQGTWYEIARYPNFFERKCVGDVTATYEPQADGTLRVLNRCRKEDGTEDIAVGIGRPDVKGGSTARFKVTFVPKWLEWVPWLYANYWIVVLDDDYHYAAIGEPSREYLWVLSRTPKLDDNTLYQIHAKLRKQGYDTDKLVLTPQKAAQAAAQ
ncbi:lipocalin family protein [Pandoraea terrae]|nr:lipocalin family protein [Pandoraea terrae]